MFLAGGLQPPGFFVFAWTNAMSVDPEAAARFEAAIEAQEALYREVTGRFQQILSEPLDDLSAIALMHIVTLGRIDFRDGFVLNGDRLEENIMGISDAAEVMSACVRTNAGSIGRGRTRQGEEGLTTSSKPGNGW